jgi:hypothetical protein
MTIAALTGLDWDELSGSLLACDGFGVVHRFLPGGTPLRPPTFPAAVPAGSVVGVAIDKTGLTNSAGVRSIYITNGAAMTEVVTGTATILRGSAVTACGLAFLPVPATRPLGTCPCTVSGPTWSWGAPSTAGSTAFSLRVGGLAPGSPALFLLGFAFSPAFPLYNANGCGLGLYPGPGVLSAFLFADASGTATFPLPLFAAPGTVVYAQAGVPCANDPAGFVLAPTVQVPLCGS